MGIEATAFAQFHFALLCFALVVDQVHCTGDRLEVASMVVMTMTMRQASLACTHTDIMSYIRLLIITMTECIMHSEKTCRIYQTNKKNEQQQILVMNVSTLVYTTYVQ